jgi:hypothetical protein
MYFVTNSFLKRKHTVCRTSEMTHVYKKTLKFASNTNKIKIKSSYYDISGRKQGNDGKKVELISK